MPGLTLIDMNPRTQHGLPQNALFQPITETVNGRHTPCNCTALSRLTLIDTDSRNSEIAAEEERFSCAVAGKTVKWMGTRRASTACPVGLSSTRTPHAGNWVLWPNQGGKPKTRKRSRTPKHVAFDAHNTHKPQACVMQIQRRIYEEMNRKFFSSRLLLP